MQYNFNLDGTDYPVTIIKSKYVEFFRLYLGLENEGEFFLDLTIFIRVPLEDDEVCIKTWDVDGIPEFLIANNIATHTGRTAPAGWTEAPIMKLTPEFMQQYNITRTKNIVEAI